MVYNWWKIFGIQLIFNFPPNFPFTIASNDIKFTFIGEKHMIPELIIVFRDSYYWFLSRYSAIMIWFYQHSPYYFWTNLLFKALFHFYPSFWSNTLNFFCNTCLSSLTFNIFGRLVCCLFSTFSVVLNVFTNYCIIEWLWPIILAIPRRNFVYSIAYLFDFMMFVVRQLELNKQRFPNAQKYGKVLARLF